MQRAILPVLLSASVVLLAIYLHAFYADVFIRQHVQLPSGTEFTYQRRHDGLVELWAADQKSFLEALGYIHAMDRRVSIFLTAFLGQGTVSQNVLNVPKTVELDMKLRGLRLGHRAKQSSSALTPKARSIVQLYADGVNAYMNTHMRPWEFLIAGVVPPEWTVDMSVSVFKIMAYVGMADIQGDVEKMIIEASRQNESSRLLMKRLFQPHLDLVPDEVLQVLHKIKLSHPVVVPEEHILPNIQASNAWALAGHRSTTGKPIYCSDPHLEVSRLPAIWKEIHAHVGDNYLSGITLPGIPGLLMGRTKHLAFGFTYGLADNLDYYIEEIRDGKYRRGKDQWIDLQHSEDIIRPKAGDPVTIHVFETVHGVVETANASVSTIEDGFYLARAYTGMHTNESATIEWLMSLDRFRTVQDVFEASRDLHVEIPMNYMLADRDGHIGYHQLGCVPIRAPNVSGLFPLPGWDERFDWKGIYNNSALKSVHDPAEGMLSSANDYHSPVNGVTVMNIVVPYRNQRIQQLLSRKQRFSIEDMKEMQMDVYSVQAEAYMKVLRPLLPKNDSLAVLLAQWDLRYASDSRGAILFEEVYEEIVRQAYGPVLGKAFHSTWVKMMMRITAFATDSPLLQQYDPASRSDDALIWRGRSRDDLFLQSALRVFAKRNGTVPPPMREASASVMLNVFFNGQLGKLGQLLGIDVAVHSTGSRATIVQGGMVRNWKGRASYQIGVSYRMVADLASDLLYSILPGGSAGNPLSPFYSNEVSDWMAGRFKLIG